MNTDITASVKPEYPVIYRNPPFTKTVANFKSLDYLRLSTITGVSVVVGYLSGALIRPINGHKFCCCPKMNAAPIFSSLQSIPNPYHYSKTSFIPNPARNFSTKNSPSTSIISSAVTELSAFTSDPAQPELTWQIVIGVLAGVMPFVVAGIEFGKRIVAQKKCVKKGGRI